MRVQMQSRQSNDSTSAQIAAKVRAMPGRCAEDERLIAKVRRDRDRDALAALAHHYGPRLKSWLIYRGESAHGAEDIVQDVMIAIWRKADRFDPAKARFSTWLYALARNRWIDRNRKERRSETKPPDEMARLQDGPVDSAEAEYNRSEASEAVRREMALLAPEQKLVLHLAFFEGLTHAQIAERTGLPLGTVKSRIRAPLKKMQEGLRRFSEHFDE